MIVICSFIVVIYFHLFCQRLIFGASLHPTPPAKSHNQEIKHIICKTILFNDGQVYIYEAI